MSQKPRDEKKQADNQSSSNPSADGTKQREEVSLSPSIEIEFGHDGGKVSTKVEKEGELVKREYMKLVADPAISVGKRPDGSTEIGASVDLLKVDFSGVNAAISAELDGHPDGRNAKDRVQWNLQTSAEQPLNDHVSVSGQASVNKNGLDGLSLVVKWSLPEWNIPNHTDSQSGLKPVQQNHDFPVPDPGERSDDYILDPLKDQKALENRLNQQYPPIKEKTYLISELKPPTEISSYAVQLGNPNILKLESLSFSQTKETSSDIGGRQSDNLSMRVHEPPQDSSIRRNQGDKKDARDNQPPAENKR